MKRQRLQSMKIWVQIKVQSYQTSYIAFPYFADEHEKRIANAFDLDTKIGKP